MIIASAVKVTKDNKTFIIMGKRHHNCLETIWDAGIRRPFIEVQGFMTDKFEFLDRLAAMEHAKIEFQVNPDMTGVLYSEDLWKDGGTP